MKPRLIAEIAGGCLILALISLSKCEGERAGKLSAEIGQAKAAEKLHRDSASTLLRKANYADSLVRVKTDSLIQSREMYKKAVNLYKSRRDTLVLTDTVEVEGVLKLADVALQAADSVIGVQGELIGVLTAQNYLFRQVITEKDGQISALNRQISLAAKQKPTLVGKVATAAKYVGTGIIIGYGLAR